MIPKIIHYCWFGGNPLPDLAKKCIDSWKKYFPDYEIKEWNETNFDIDCCDYVREAYEEKKWAFVSDYARYWVLYHEGGLYFDTDVEIIKDMKDIVSMGSFMGCEYVKSSKNEHNKKNYNQLTIGVAPGLGLGIEPGLSLIKEILDFYNIKHFRLQDGNLDKTTIVKYTTDFLKQYGWEPNGNLQCIEDLYIYPVDYFCPMNYETAEINITSNTRSIHHYTASWLNEKEKKYHYIKQKLTQKFGYKTGTIFFKIIYIPHRIIVKVEKKGLIGTFKFVYIKYLKRRP